MSLHDAQPLLTADPSAARTAPVVVLDSPDGQLLPLRDSLAAAEIEADYHQIADPDTDLAQLLADSAVLVTESVHIRQDLISTLPNLRLIVRAGIGIDIIDVAYARSVDVRVANVPDYCVEEVADHAVLLLLATVRQLSGYVDDVQEGAWAVPPRTGVRRMSKLVVGVIGLGGIGQGVVQRLRGFGCTLLVHDPYVTLPPEDGVRNASVEEVLTHSDVISLHCPLTETTRGLINAASLRQNPRRPFLINVSRGDLVELDGLADLLDSGEVRGIGVDVLPGEPWPDLQHPFVKHPQTLVTPHVAWWSDDAAEELNASIHNTVQEFIETGQLPANVEVVL